MYYAKITIRAYALILLACTKNLFKDPYFILWCDDRYPTFIEKLLSNYYVTFSLKIVVIKLLLTLAQTWSFLQKKAYH